MVRLTLIACLGGCGIVSGLDSLTIIDVDAGDATADAPVDAPSSVDGGADADGDSGCTPFSTTVTTCGPNAGTSPCALPMNDCCLGVAGGECASACPAGNIVFSCRNSADCSSSTANQHCCLTRVNLAPGCMPSLNVPSASESFCTNAECETLDGGGVRLCATTSDCTTGETCKPAALHFLSAMPWTLGVCAPN
jgi:hypothetical protein